MKQLLIFLSALISLASYGQARFCQQIDHTTHFGCNLQISPSDLECDGLDSMRVKYIRHEINLSSYNGGQDNGLETRYERGFRILLNVNWGAGSQPRLFPTGADLTTFSTRLETYLTRPSGTGYFYYQAVTVAVVENEPFNQGYYDYSRTSVRAYLAELEAVIAVCHKYGIKVADGASHIAYYPSISNPPLSGPAKYADSAFRKYPNSYDKIQLDFVNWHTNMPLNGWSSNSAMSPLGKLAQWTDSLRSWTNHSNVICNELHQEPEANRGDPPTTPAQQDALCVSLVTETRDCRLVYMLNFGGDQDGATGCTSTIEQRAIQLINNITSNIQLCHLGIAYRDAVASGQ